MKKLIFLIPVAVTVLFLGVGVRYITGKEPEEKAPRTEPAATDISTDSGHFETEENDMKPGNISPIPEGYKTEATKQGSLEEVCYDTYDSLNYGVGEKTLRKKALIYLPYGYDETKQYNICYLMHGGWRNEETLLKGTAGSSSPSWAPEAPPDWFKNVLDNAMENGDMQPMIIVCPTYNNLSVEDSADYSLALTLTGNYHNELLNDLIPAVESQYSTYANGDVTISGIENFRNHRGFGGFSMGGVCTWRVFEYCLDYFRYFMPMSGAADAGAMDAAVKNSKYGPDDFFLWTASGTSDFAFSGFNNQVMSMIRNYPDTFHFTDNERNGNLCYCVENGGTHDLEHAHEYTYNGLCQLWREDECVIKRGIYKKQIL